MSYDNKPVTHKSHKASELALSKDANNLSRFTARVKRLILPVGCEATLKRAPLLLPANSRDLFRSHYNILRKLDWPFRVQLNRDDIPFSNIFQ